jgi:hypothetical protein
MFSVYCWLWQAIFYFTLCTEKVVWNISHMAMGHQIPATENVVLTSGAAHLEELRTLFWAVEPGLGCHVQRRKGARWARVTITREASLQIEEVEFCTFLNRVDAVGRNVNRGWKDVSKCAVQETIPTERARLVYRVSRKLPLKVRTSHRDYCSEQPVISKPRWDWAVVLNWGGFKLSPEVRCSEPKSYEHLLPLMHKLKEHLLLSSGDWSSSSTDFYY